MTNDQSPAVNATSHRYSPELAASIENKWQTYWTTNGTFEAPNPVGPFAVDGKLPEDRKFIQDMFPYPSGAGLHVGHPLGYIATDVFARFHRMKGANVLHTLGYDAFGLPAEQYAVQTGTHPRTTTMANIENMERQLGRLGLGHDKRRAIATTDTEFYRWTQWIFLQIFNSWFDPEATNPAGGKGAARPIAELEAKLAAERDDWGNLSEAERQAVLDEYRLVYRSNSMVNWCPGLGTVLANEEVTADGRSERGNFPVFRKNLQQWMMRITAYSDRLIDDLDYLDWTDKVKSMQRNWIGRSRGAQVSFATPVGDVEVFTTRPDTLFGATYMVLAPEHELVDALVAHAMETAGGAGEYAADVPQLWKNGEATPAAAVAAYRAAIAAKSDLERQENKEKTGVYLGVTATNPVDGREIPIFIGDYVLTGYGTGAIMAVPAHDTRDYEFAKAFDLDIIPVVDGDISEEAFTEDAPHINSANDRGLVLNGLNKAEAIDAAIAWLEAEGRGFGKIQYKLRDWLFARQRYWGEPFPIVYDADGVAHPLPDSMLPVELPEVEDYKPVSFDPEDADSVPQPPLAKAKEWVEVELDLGRGDGVQTYWRDTNVMPQWAGSSWYQLRYIDPANDTAFVDYENEKYWTGPREGRPSGGVDLYVGGVEHAVLHLLYSRFWHKVLFDLGHVSSFEPYHRLYNQGYIQAYAYTDSRGVYVPAEEVVERDGKFFYTPGEDGEKAGFTPGVEIEVQQEYGKMGKSLKNSVSPDEICDSYGADTLRVYEMAMGPLDTSRPWATKDVVGAQRFLQRAWRLVVNEATGELAVTDAALTDDDLRALHRTTAGVHEDYAELRDNTAVAKLIEYVNYLTKTYGGPGGVVAAPRAAVVPLVQMLAPLAPHIAEELWERLGGADGAGTSGTITFEPFPTWDEQWLVDDTVEVPVQVLGKIRARIQVPLDADAKAIEAQALAEPNVQSHLEGKEIVKIIVVPGKMVNIVAK